MFLSRSSSRLMHHASKSVKYHQHSTKFSESPRALISDLDPVANPRFPATSLRDSVPRGVVRFLRWASDLYFKDDLIRRATMLETVAAVPGMVTGVLHHLRSLRRAEQSEWIKVTMDEAENERMHLMSFIQLHQPTPFQRVVIFGTQAVFTSLYATAYLISPQMSHRFVGYLEEEAVVTYSKFLKMIDEGKVKNIPAPPIAIEYWGLPKDATLRDMIVIIRADECDHRDVNHYLSNSLAMAGSAAAAKFAPGETDIDKIIRKNVVTPQKIAN